MPNINIISDEPDKLEITATNSQSNWIKTKLNWCIENTAAGLCLLLMNAFD
jgi:hypothetical protein